MQRYQVFLFSFILLMDKSLQSQFHVVPVHSKGEYPDPAHLKQVPLQNHHVPKYHQNLRIVVLRVSTIHLLQNCTSYSVNKNSHQIKCNQAFYDNGSSWHCWWIPVVDLSQSISVDYNHCQLSQKIKDCSINMQFAVPSSIYCPNGSHYPENWKLTQPAQPYMGSARILGPFL